MDCGKTWSVNWKAERPVLRAIAAALLVLLVATATSRDETFPSCYEDEYAVRVVGIWDGTVNEMRQSTDDTTIYCVASDDLRTKEE